MPPMRLTNASKPDHSSDRTDLNVVDSERCINVAANERSIDLNVASRERSTTTTATTTTTTTTTTNTTTTMRDSQQLESVDDDIVQQLLEGFTQQTSIEFSENTLRQLYLGFPSALEPGQRCVGQLCSTAELSTQTVADLDVSLTDLLNLYVTELGTLATQRSASPAISREPSPQPGPSGIQTGGAVRRVQDHVNIGMRFNRSSAIFNVERSRHEVQFTNMDLVDDVDAFLPEAFDYVLAQVFDDALPTDWIGIAIHHPALDTPIHVPFSNRDKLNGNVLLHLIEDIQQSNKDLNVDDEMVWEVTKCGMPVGSAPKRKHTSRFSDWLESKTGHGCSIIRVPNDDNKCLARALVTAKAHAHKGDSALAMNHYNTVRRGDTNRNTAQKRLATQLMLEAGLQQHVGGCGLDELALMMRTPTLAGYHVQIYSSTHHLRRVFDEGVGPTLNLLHHENHYVVITTLPGFFEQSYFCDKCQKAYQHKREHRQCGHRCPCCCEIGVCEQGGWVGCGQCRRWFRSQRCYDNHKRERVYTVEADNKRERKAISTCTQVYKCGKMIDGVQCEETVLKGHHKHECGKIQCRICRQMVKRPHLCHIQTVDKSPKSPPSYIFFDCETSQDTVVDHNDYGDIYGHMVNLVCATKVNMQTLVEEHVQFEGAQAVDSFCDYLFQPAHKDCIAIAHNAKGFDAQFLVPWIHKQGARTPTVIKRGTELLSLEYNGVKVIDSLSFLPMGLAALPKALGFPAEKGYFPHHFNTADNWEVDQDELPDAYYYGPAQMKPDQRTAFYRWYLANKATRFNFREQIVRYCKLDVSILKEACLRFRATCLQNHDVDPFATSITIASLCMFLYKKKFLTPNTIGVVPAGGYRKGDVHSKKALRWLKWMSHSEGKQIQHAKNGGEVNVNAGGCSYKLDGVNRQNPNEVFEFQGCIWHGCPDCFPDPNTILPVSNQTADEAYIAALVKVHNLEQAGYTVRSVWECQVDRALKANPVMQAYYNTLQIDEPLDPREAFFGGRTNVRKMLHKCGEGERIDYADVCSLYPFVCKYGAFPIGHPSVLTENFEPLDTKPYHGLIKCVVLPPKGLLHPVLPYRSKHKLLFPLCAMCADQRGCATDRCQHTDEQRQLKGAWCSVELYKAIEMGYRIVEVYHYTDWTKHEVGRPDTGVFTRYVDFNLKEKQEASGWPSNADGSALTDEQKVQYVEEYKQHEGVDLDPAKIEVNPGRRALAKLCLNSHWGKFGQNVFTHTVYFTDPTEYYQCVLHPGNIIKDVSIVHDTMVSVTYGKDDDYVEEGVNTSVVYAAFVTAQARLKLYTYIEQLGDRVLYMDTDSVIYLSKPTDTYQVPLGRYLGDMTDELGGSSITEFVCLGPKQYAYVCASGKTAVKIRGFTLTNTAAKRLNMKGMKQMLINWMNGRPTTIDIVAPQLRRSNAAPIVTRTYRKTYRVCYDKCTVDRHMVCYPFGYDP